MKLRIAIGIALLIFIAAPLYAQVKKKQVRAKLKKENRIVKEEVESPTIIPSANSASSNHLTPGVYIEELPLKFPEISQVATAIPAFIGYTEKGPNIPIKINSLQEYLDIFGGPFLQEIGTFEIDIDGNISPPEIKNRPKFNMFYMLQMYFANGGGECFVVSAGNYATVNNSDMLMALQRLDQEYRTTLLLFPDALSSLNSNNPAVLYQAALEESSERKNRFVICDVDEVNQNIVSSIEQFRTSIGNQNLAYGAAYFPFLETTLKYVYAEDQIQIKLQGSHRRGVLKHSDETIAENPEKIEESLYHVQNGDYRNVYHEIKDMIDEIHLKLPPSAAVAGVYVHTDQTRGVWKAPANVALNKVKEVSLYIDDSRQSFLNVHHSGKSINAIRNFSGKGIMVWGGRTMAGNDLEKRYISSARFVGMVDASITNALQELPKSPNDQETWQKVKLMAENYLMNLWRDGALQGTKPEKAFFVRIGLNETMTEQDVLQGKLNLQVGLSIMKPSEFFIINISQSLNSN